MAAALAACRLRRATLVIAKLDRLARNVHFVSGLMECLCGPRAGAPARQGSRGFFLGAQGQLLTEFCEVASSHSAHGTMWEARSRAGSVMPVIGQRPPQ
jgi:hypothetical protein